MTRTDALLFAARKMLEQFRPMLDSTSPIRSVTLEMKVTPQNHVRSVLLSPEFESHEDHPKIEKYAFKENA